MARKAVLTFLKIADLMVVGISLLVAVAATGGAHDIRGWIDVLQMRVKVGNLLFVAAYLGLWHVTMRARGLYGSYRLAAAARELRDLSVAVTVAVGVLAVVALPLRFQFVTIEFLIAFFALAFAGLGIERRMLRALARRIRHHGRNLRNVVVVGSGNEALNLAARLARRDDLGYHVAGVIEPNTGAADNGHGPGAVVARVQSLIDAQPIDEIFLALPLDAAQPLIRELTSVCEEQGITVRVLAHVASLHWARAIVDSLEGQPLLTIQSGPPDALGLVAKRVIDVVVAALALVLLAPLLVVVAIAVKLGSPGPVFFVQERVGLNRRHFRAYKFRTMVDGADEMQASLEPFNEADGPVFKIENDPRITRLGRWLRRLSIDECPQLFNVLKGEMSLVGPRPLPVRDVDRIDVRWHKRRFSVKPGITCLWQVNSREPKFDEWIRQDMEYIDNWSLALDLRILAKTIPAVLSGQGAH
jgi:exopolysaccharide biosynthesis polyprenyl glycosylphosphotransferase